MSGRWTWHATIGVCRQEHSERRARMADRSVLPLIGSRAVGSAKRPDLRNNRTGHALHRGGRDGAAPRLRQQDAEGAREGDRLCAQAQTGVAPMEKRSGGAALPGMRSSTSSSTAKACWLKRRNARSRIVADQFRETMQERGLYQDRHGRAHVDRPPPARSAGRSEESIRPSRHLAPRRICREKVASC